MARRFQAGQRAVFAAPAALTSGGGADAGPLTMMAVVKVNTTGYQCPIYARTSGGAHAWAAEYTSSGGVTTGAMAAGSTARAVNTVTRSAWIAHFFRKDAGGTFQPIGRVLSGANFATDSGDVTAGSTLSDGPALDAGGTLTLGRWGTTDESDDLEVAGLQFWRSLLTGAQCVAKPTWALGLASPAPDYWITCAGSTFVDSAGASPTLTGAPSVTADPSGYFGSSVVALAGAASLGGITAAGILRPRIVLAGAASLGGIASAAALQPRVALAGAASLGGITAAGILRPRVALAGAASLGGITAAALLTIAGSVSLIGSASLGGITATLRLTTPGSTVRAGLAPASRRRPTLTAGRPGRTLRVGS
jgi:hypothetical protein